MKSDTNIFSPRNQKPLQNVSFEIYFQQFPGHKNLIRFCLEKKDLTVFDLVWGKKRSHLVLEQYPKSMGAKNYLQYSVNMSLFGFTLIDV